jgi:HSP20 family protein
MALAKLMRIQPLDLIQEMNRFLAPALHNTSQDNEFSGIGAAEWLPPIDIKEKDEQIVLHADLPGMKMEDIHVRMQENTITIEGERKLEKEEKKGSTLRIERSYGKFSRSFTLPNVVDQEKIKATYQDGVLEIALPKKQTAQTRVIEINKS